MSNSCNYRPQRGWGKVTFLQASVILSTGGEYLTRYTPQDQVPPPQTRHPPGPARQTPGTRYTPTPPPAQSMLGDTVNARAVRILECNLVFLFFSQDIPFFNHSYRWTSCTSHNTTKVQGLITIDIWGSVYLQSYYRCMKWFKHLKY